MSDDQIDRRLAKGEFERLHRGVARLRSGQPTESASALPSTSPPGMLLPPELAAALLACGPRDVVFSHVSAARLLGLPKPLGGWGSPQLTATSGSGRIRNGIQIRVAPLAPDEIFHFRGIPLTRPLRTVLDCLRTLPAPDGLAILDRALQRKWFSLGQLMTAADSQQRWPGIARARTVMVLGDGRRESPLESWSAWAFDESGVPPPQWQVVLRDQNGSFVARADSWWHGVAGEADGRSKYALAAAERGGTGAKELFDVLQAEREREQAIRGIGADVIRWSTADVLRPVRRHHLAQRIRAAISLAQETMIFTGTVAPFVPQLVTAPRSDHSPS